MRIVVATSNLGKLAEFRDLLAGFAVEGLDVHPRVTLPEETGTTYKDNAILKAEAAASATGLPSIGDDSGIEVPILDNAPGLFSARYAKERLPGEAQDAANRRTLLDALHKTGRPPAQWTARFCCALAYAEPGQPTQTFWGEIAGLVLPQARGTGGFGYDPIVYAPEFEKTFAEIDEAEKNRVSHRGRAVAGLIEYLRRR